MITGSKSDEGEDRKMLGGSSSRSRGCGLLERRSLEEGEEKLDCCLLGELLQKAKNKKINYGLEFIRITHNWKSKVKNWFFT